LDKLRSAKSNSAVSAIVITGEGKFFCSGGDIKAYENLEESRADKVGRVLADVYNPLVRLIFEMPKPVIASINGPCIGAGAALALAADIVFAAKSVSFSFPFVPRLAAVPDLGTSWHLPRLIGRGAALALTLTGETISADEAATMGLVWKSVPDEQLESVVHDYANRLARMPAGAVARVKFEMSQALGNSFDAQVALERQLQIACFSGEEVAEAFTALSERRQPRFRR
jgi:2-(1,2-epoxy-1,2-dihydrophenyl)acetyl-CoA isomerase